jgi:hypothetical protein
VSRAEPRLPAPPTLRGAVRGAAEDLYYNSFRFLGANLLLGLVLIAVALVSLGTLAGLLGLVVAAPPAAGIMRMATTLQRDGHTGFGEFTDAVRRPWGRLVIAAIQLLALLVLVVDALLGGAMGGLAGAFLTVSALYGVLIWWLFGLALWPLLEDPRRDDPIRGRLRLAAMVLVAFPLRMLAVGLLLGALLAISAVAVAPLVTISVAFAWLVAARYVLPLADRLEGRLPDIPAEEDGWPRATGPES